MAAQQGCNAHPVSPVAGKATVCRCSGLRIFSTRCFWRGKDAELASRRRPRAGNLSPLPAPGARLRFQRLPPQPSWPREVPRARAGLTSLRCLRASPRLHRSQRSRPPPHSTATAAFDHRFWQALAHVLAAAVVRWRVAHWSASRYAMVPLLPACFLRSVDRTSTQSDRTMSSGGTFACSAAGGWEHVQHS